MDTLNNLIKNGQMPINQLLQTLNNYSQQAQNVINASNESINMRQQKIKEAQDAKFYKQWNK